MTARWRSSIVLDQFPLEPVPRRSVRTYASDALAREVAAPGRRAGARTRGSIRRMREFLYHAVHAFGASARPVALHRAVRTRPAMPKT